MHSAIAYDCLPHELVLLKRCHYMKKEAQQDDDRIAIRKVRVKSLTKELRKQIRPDTQTASKLV